AALPGVVGGYLLAGERSLPAMLAGALVTGLVRAGLAWVLTHRVKVKSEAALGTGLGLGFALGVVLLSYVQRQPGAGSAGLESFLYGQAADTLRADVLVLAGVAVVGLGRSEEHTSELQSRENLVCRLLLEKKKKDDRQN